MVPAILGDIIQEAKKERDLEASVGQCVSNRLVVGIKWALSTAMTSANVIYIIKITL